MSTQPLPHEAPDDEPAFVLSPNGGKKISKVERYNWQIVDRPGTLLWIDKQELNVDHRYQRESVNKVKVTQIASEWSWMACGVLLVVQREDGTFWIYDGQHRKLAADKRSDIDKLPCCVFSAAGIQDEAGGFFRSNTARTPVYSVDKFRALVIVEDATAIAVNEMVRLAGYTVKGGGDWTCKFATRLMDCYRLDSDVCKFVWSLTADIYAGKRMDERIFAGLYYLERFLRKKAPDKSLSRPDLRREMNKLKVGDALESIQKASSFFKGAGGMRAWAQGIVQLFNHGRSKNRLPNVMGDD